MKRIERKRLEALLRVKDVTDVFMSDLSIAAESLNQHAIKFNPSDSMWEMSFWGKTALRTFLSHVDGLCYMMRRTVVDMAAELGVELAEKRRLALAEQRVTREGKLVEARLSPVDSLKLAFRHYPALFGVDFKLDLGGDHWKAFLALAEIRNEITHPKTIEDMLGREMYRFWVPGYTWFLARLSEVLSVCAGAIPEVAPSFERLQIPPYRFEARQENLFSDVDYVAIRSISLRVLEYTKQAFGVLMQDTSQALGFSNDLAKIDTLIGKSGQFGLRNWVRTFFAEVEGTISIAEFFITSSAERKEFSLSPGDQESLGGDFEMDEKLVRTLNIWSREFGYQKQARLAGKDWQAFRNALKIRNRLTHPKSPKDLRVGIDEMDTIVAADSWFREITELVYLDSENWARKARDL